MKRLSAILALAAVSLLLLLILKVFVGDVYTISSDSMAPTLRQGDRVLVLLADKTPERGDIVVVRDEQRDPLVKRVAGLPGEEVALTAAGDLRIQRRLLDRREGGLPLIDLFDSRRSAWGPVWRLPESFEEGGGAVVLRSGEDLAFRAGFSDGQLASDGSLLPGHLLVGDGGLEFEGLSLDEGATLTLELSEAGDLYLLRIRLAGDLLLLDILVETAQEPALLRASWSGPEDAEGRLSFFNLDEQLLAITHSQPVLRVVQGPPSPAKGDAPRVGERARIRVEGGKARFSRLRVRRDVHYSPRGTFAVDHPVLLGPNEIFLLGDASEQSVDSRSYGPVSLTRLLGRVVLGARGR